VCHSSILNVAFRTLISYIGANVQELVIISLADSCLPWIPEQGTVGASGDLAPLSHMALGLMGKGRMWSPDSGWTEAKYVLEANGIRPLSLSPKEGKIVCYNL